MSEDQNPAKRTTKSGISVDKGTDDFELTATVALSRKGMGLSKKKAQAPAPPAPDQTRGMVYSVATDDDVACPRCQSQFEVSSDIYDAVAECPECSLMFVIKAPGTPPFRGAIPGAESTPGAAASGSLDSSDMLNTFEIDRNKPTPANPRGASTSNARPPAPRPPKRTSSGIDVDKNGNQDYGLTATVTLSRRGMGMHQKKRDDIQAPAQQTQGMVYSVANQDEVACPKCKSSFEISPEFYNAIAECPECACEFVIRPPGTPPPARRGSRPVQQATGSGPVPVPASARPAPPQRPAAPRTAAASPPEPREDIEEEAEAPAAPAPPTTKSPTTRAARGASKAASQTAQPARSSTATPRKRTETSIRDLDQLTQAPPPKKNTQATVILITGAIIVVMIAIVGILVWSLI